MKKLRVAVLFGGRSAEHEVSLVSAASIINALDPNHYEPVLIGITHNGRWIVHEKALQMLQQGKIETNISAFPAADPTVRSILLLDYTAADIFAGEMEIDVIFPVLHGTYGEDGTMQGLFELMDIPYVGAGVLGSAVGMDKVIQKQLFAFHRLPVVQFLSFTKNDEPQKAPDKLAEIEARLGYPMFIKPANLGSSIGVTKAIGTDELKKAIGVAFEYDRKIIIEKSVENAREIEISVLGSDELRASVPGEVKPTREFYDYQAKYEDTSSLLNIPANLPENMKKNAQQLAIKAVKAIDCSGMARVDFLLTGDQLYVSEVNTIPGFTKISMYPKLWEASGLSYSQLLDELIRLAMEKHQQKKQLKTHATKITDWYKNN